MIDIGSQTKDLDSSFKMDSYQVPASTSQCCHYRYQVETDFTQTPSRTKSEIHDMLKIITALLNTSGGVVTMVSSHKNVKAKTVNDWIHMLMDGLREAFSQRLLTNYIAFETEGSPLHCVHIMVKMSSQLVTLNYNLFNRLSTQTIPVKEIDSAVKIMQQDDTEATSLQPFLNAKYQSAIRLEESLNIEFKCWQIKSSSDLIKRFRSDVRTQKTLLAMTNLPTGGHLLIGLKEDQKDKKTKVLGQILSEQGERDFENVVSEIMNSDSTDENYGIWRPEKQDLQKGKHWDVQFYPVDKSPERRVLIHIKLNHIKGGVFKMEPESYEITDFGPIQKIPFIRWRAKLLKCTHTPKPMVPFCDLLPDPHSQDIKSREGEGQNSKSTHTEEDIERLNQALKMTETLSWTKNKKNWKENISMGGNKLHESLSQMQDILNIKSPLSFHPDKNVIFAADREHKVMLRKCMFEIDKTHEGTKGFVIAARRLLKNVQETTKLNTPHGHIMDFLSIDEKCNIHLWTVIHNSRPKDEGEHKFYLYNMGRLLKRFVLNKIVEELCDKTSASIHAFHIQGHVFYEDGCTGHTYLDELCCTHFKNVDSWNDIVLSFGKLFLQKETPLKRSVGDKSLINMTMQQMAPLIGMDISRFNLIQGPPGAGKTLLAIYLAKRYGKKNTLICLPNPCLEQYVKYQDVCETKVLKRDQDLQDLVTHYGLDGKTCVIFDDCQHTEFADSSWHHLFLAVLAEPSMFIFLFCDNEIQNFRHTDSDHMKSLKRLFDEFTTRYNVPYMSKRLATVYRNSHKVVSFIKAGFKDRECEISCGHNEEGDDVEVIRIPNIRSIDKDNGLVKLVKGLADSKSLIYSEYRAYGAEEIAVLIDGENAEDMVVNYTTLFNKYLSECKVQRADKYPVEGLIIEKLDNFSGLESSLCIIIADSKTFKPDSEDQANTIKNPRYKAFVASRGVYKVVLVTDVELNYDIFRSLKMDTMWHADDSHLSEVSQRSDGPCLHKAASIDTLDKPSPAPKPVVSSKVQDQQKPPKLGIMYATTETVGRPVDMFVNDNKRRLRFLVESKQAWKSSDNLDKPLLSPKPSISKPLTSNNIHNENISPLAESMSKFKSCEDSDKPVPSPKPKHIPKIPVQYVRNRSASLPFNSLSYENPDDHKFRPAEQNCDLNLLKNVPTPQITEAYNEEA